MDIFKQVMDERGQPLMKKYGASTTWIGKLIYRLDSRRNGGCSILAVGIKRNVLRNMTDLIEYYSRLKAVYGGEEV